MKKYSLARAIKSLYPSAIFVVKNNSFDSIVWNDDLNPDNPRPTEEELDNEGNKIMLIDAQNIVLAEIDRQRDELAQKPVLVTINGRDRYIQAKQPLDLLRLINANIAWQDSTPTQDWICLDNEVPGAEVSKSDLESACNHIRARLTSLASLARSMKNEVLALLTVDEVENYTIAWSP